MNCFLPLQVTRCRHRSCSRGARSHWFERGDGGGQEREEAREMDREIRWGVTLQQT